MAVPKISQLRPSVAVNIVLKAHQQTGTLTRGNISEILTRGDHPRGIKVRLVDGRIGRVQSLAVESDSATVVRSTPIPFASDSISGGASGFSRPQSDRVGREGKVRGHPMHDEQRGASEPQGTRSLADYIKVAPTSKPASAPYSSGQENINQIQLEKEFPTLDTALIAAILADHDDFQSARGVLSSLN